MPERAAYDEAMLLSQARLKVQDQDLKQGNVETITLQTVAGSMKRPWGIQGGFAVVYKFRPQNGRLKALRCFLVIMNSDIQWRYESISMYFHAHVPDITIDFQYYEEGISVSETIRGFWQKETYPVIAMEWVNGVTLLDKVNELCQQRDKQELEKLAGQWLVVLKKMHQAHIAHGDLSGVNVMVRPNGQLVLIDYDGVYIPAFAGLQQVVAGEPDYQHPDMMHRPFNRPFNEHMDDFSALVIYVSLLALQMQPELWDKHVKRSARGLPDNNMLFTRDDFANADTSPLFADLLHCSDTKVRELAGTLKAFCKQSVEQVHFPMHLLEPDYDSKRALQQLEVAIRDNNDERIIQLWIPPLVVYGPAQKYLPRVIQAKQQRERIDRAASQPIYNVHDKTPATASPVPKSTKQEKQASSIKIFYCYAHEDKEFRDELGKHLRPLKRLGQITEWYDRNIEPGTEWANEIEVRLNTADIVLLLISPDFMNSDYCWSVEMDRALERHRAGEARVIPIILRPTFWKGTPIETLQMLPSEAKPVTRWATRDDAFEDVTKEIYEVVQVLMARTRNAEPLESSRDVK